MTSVCRYLVSDNVATLLHYWIRKTEGNWLTDIITSLLLLISVLILFGPIRTEFRETKIYHKLCIRNTDDYDMGENMAMTRANSGRYGSNSLLVKRNNTQSSISHNEKHLS